MFNLKETADNLKNKAIELNNDVLKATDGVVDETIAAGEEWNKVLAKALKTGTYLFAQQQDLALTAMEGAKTQIKDGNKRLRKLLGFQTAEKMFNDIKEDVNEAVEDAVETVEKTAKKAKKVLASTAKEVKAEAAPKAAKAKKVLATTKKTTAKKVLATTKKAAAKVKADDLKVINGIGPKMEKVLNAKGIKSYADLAVFNPIALKDLLVGENPRYAMYEPKEWVAEAKKMAK